MRCFTLLAGVCLILAAQAAATISPKCMAYRSQSTPTPVPNLVNCPQYRDLACCDNTTDSLIIPNENGTQLYGFDWDRCGALSPACQKFFQAESCYFECDPYQHPFGNPTSADPVGFVAVPVCGSYCNAWFEACKNDRTCGDEWMTDFVPVKDSEGNTVSYACSAGSQCKTFSEVFRNGKNLCDTLWGAAFRYTDETDNCVVWDWAQTTSNPNSHLVRKASQETHCNADFVPPKPEPEVEAGCLAGREFASPQEVPKGDLGVCSRYSDLSCCGSRIANFITQDINDPSIHWYDWTQCKPLSEKCEAFFKAESCYYECDPYVHQWKNPILVAPDSSLDIPLCSKTCDAWFDACKEDLTCGVEWLTDFVPIKNGTETYGFKCPEGSQCKTFAEVFQNSREMCDMLWGSHYYYSENTDNCVQWVFDNKNPNKDVYKTHYAGEACPAVSEPANTAAIVLGVFFAVTFIGFGALIVFMVIRERKQAPLFGVPMARVK